MFQVIDNVEEAWALYEAGLLWWDKREPAHAVWRDRREPRRNVHISFEEGVNKGVFSILLEE